MDDFDIRKRLPAEAHIAQGLYRAYLASARTFFSTIQKEFNVEAWWNKKIDKVLFLDFKLMPFEYNIWTNEFTNDEVIHLKEDGVDAAMPNIKHLKECFTICKGIDTAHGKKVYKYQAEWGEILIKER